jgi:hypothetical protein
MLDLEWKADKQGQVAPWLCKSPKLRAQVEQSRRGASPAAAAAGAWGWAVEAWWAIGGRNASTRCAPSAVQWVSTHQTLDPSAPFHPVLVARFDLHACKPSAWVVADKFVVGRVIHDFLSSLCNYSHDAFGCKISKGKPNHQVHLWAHKQDMKNWNLSQVLTCMEFNYAPKN